MTARSWRVALSDDERSLLEEVVSSGRGAARRIRRARILLDLDEGRDEGLLAGLDELAAGGAGEARGRQVALCLLEPGLHLLGLRIAGAVIVQAGFTDRHHPGQRDKSSQLCELGVEGHQPVALEEPGGVVGVNGDGRPDPGVSTGQLRCGTRRRQVATDVHHPDHPDGGGRIE